MTARVARGRAQKKKKTLQRTFVRTKDETECGVLQVPRASTIRLVTATASPTCVPSSRRRASHYIVDGRRQTIFEHLRNDPLRRSVVKFIEMAIKRRGGRVGGCTRRVDQDGDREERRRAPRRRRARRLRPVRPTIADVLTECRRRSTYYAI